jgi:hypothetical protein
MPWFMRKTRPKNQKEKGRKQANNINNLGAHDLLFIRIAAYVGLLT